MTGGGMDARLDAASPKAWRSASPIVILIALAALWPGLINGGPFYHPDTPTYLRSAAAGSHEVTGLSTSWTDEYLRHYAGGKTEARPSGTLRTQPKVPVTLKGRSIYYGAFLYLSYLLGSLWIAVAVQSLLAATSTYLTVRLIGRAQGREVPPTTVLIIGLIAALGTPLGFVAGSLMPEIFTGMGVLALANLLFLWGWQSRPEKVFWIAILAYSMLVHSTNIMLAFALLAVSLAYMLWRKLPINLAQLASIGGCIAGGLLGQTAYSMAVKSVTGEPPVRAPFIAMRLIADGPGYDYLKENCLKERYVYCRVLGQEHPHSDALLWNLDPKVSLFRGLDADDQRASADQQTQFMIAVFKEKPLEVIATVARNSAVQLVQMDLRNFNYSHSNRERYESTVPGHLLASMKLTRAYNGHMPTHFVEFSMALMCVLSLLFLIALLTSRLNSNAGPQVRAYSLSILAGIAINAAICGALSGPKGRYEARLIWVLPIVAAAVAAGSGIGAPTRYRSKRASPVK